MARVTHVKKAQQRFEMVPVIDQETGEQKQVPVMNKRTGEQKVTKRGKPVFRRLTVEDRSKPLPNLRCGSCSTEIKPGDPYKWIAPKSGPYGGARLVRCGACPVWYVWEYSSSMGARLAQISHNFFGALDGLNDPDEVTALLEDAGQEVRELAEEKQESAQNIEDGFGHPTTSSEELEEVAQELESWADEIEALDVPELPEPEEQDCDECAGTGYIEDEDADEDAEDEECSECDASGTVTPEDLTDEQMEEWREEVRDVCSLVDEAPV